MEFTHIPVMLEACLEGLAIRGNGVYVDGTAGGAGHSVQIAKRLCGGQLIAFDQDPDAVSVAAERLSPYAGARVIRENFRNMRPALEAIGVARVDGVLLDLGVSSFQLDTPERGFSYQKDAPLDMRMAKEGPSAKDLVNTASALELARILREYGEEKFAFRIAQNIVKKRQSAPIETTFQLGDIVAQAMPAAARREKNPCKRSFQALRIAVNSELDALSQGLEEAFDLLSVNGRLCIITFHSLEDRLVKQKFAALCQGCTCPPEFPVCICGHEPEGKLTPRKQPVLPCETECEQNRRSKSAKLRVIEKLRDRAPKG